MWTPSGSDGLADIAFLRRPTQSKKSSSALLPEQKQQSTTHSKHQQVVDVAFVCSQVTENIIHHLVAVVDVTDAEQVARVLRLLELGHHTFQWPPLLAVGTSNDEATRTQRRKRGRDEEAASGIPLSFPVRSMWTNVVTRLLQRVLEANAVAATTCSTSPLLPSPGGGGVHVVAAPSSVLKVLELIAAWTLRTLGSDEDFDNEDPSTADDRCGGEGMSGRVLGAAAGGGVVPPPHLLVPAHEIQPLLYTLREAADTRAAGASPPLLRLLQATERVVRSKCIRRL